MQLLTYNFYNTKLYNDKENIEYWLLKKKNVKPGQTEWDMWTLEPP